MADRSSLPVSDTKATYQFLSSSGDLRGGTPGDWIAVGWFTPDYQPLAEHFAANLAEHRVPFHLFARPKIVEGWNTLQKPSVVLDAMCVYPDKTLVLMDVDCIVRGDIAPVTDIGGDVGLVLKARQVRKGLAWQKPITILLSSRVVVFRPTDRARAFAQEWERECAQAKMTRTEYSGDETALGWAFLRRPEVAATYLPDRYKGWEVDWGNCPADAVIVHASAHGRMRPNRFSQAIKARLKAVERRYFRTGRTKRVSQARLG